MLSESWFRLYLDGRSETAYEYLSIFPRDVAAADPELTALIAASELNRGSPAGPADPLAAPTFHWWASKDLNCDLFRVQGRREMRLDNLSKT